MRLEAELDNLERMLGPWREKLRHEAQFWPQFDVLAQEIMARADATDREYVQQRLDAMLARHAAPDTRIAGGASAPTPAPGKHRG